MYTTHLIKLGNNGLTYLFNVTKLLICNWLQFINKAKCTLYVLGANTAVTIHMLLLVTADVTNIEVKW